MKRALSLLALTALLGGCAPPRIVRIEVADDTPKPVLTDVCSTLGEIANARLMTRTAALRERALTRRSDPVADAEAEAAAGRLSLIWAHPFGSPYAPGVMCEAPVDASHRTPAAAATIGISDVLEPADMREVGVLLAYAAAFNRTIIANPAFPYRDICRVAGGDDVYRVHAFHDPRTFAGKPGAPALGTRDLHEAARRGAASEVRRWIADGAEVDGVDGFGLTPLAWAVVRGRDDIVRQLLDAGADPLGKRAYCDRNVRAAPLWFALTARRRAAFAAMSTPEVLERLGPWPLDMILAAQEAGWPDQVLRMLEEPHDGVSPVLEARLRTAARAGDR